MKRTSQRRPEGRLCSRLLKRLNLSEQATRSSSMVPAAASEHRNAFSKLSRTATARVGNQPQLPLFIRLAAGIGVRRE